MLPDGYFKKYNLQIEIENHYRKVLAQIVAKYSPLIVLEYRQKPTPLSVKIEQDELVQDALRLAYAIEQELEIGPADKQDFNLAEAWRSAIAHYEANGDLRDLTKYLRYFAMSYLFPVQTEQDVHDFFTKPAREFLPQLSDPAKAEDTHTGLSLRTLAVKLSTYTNSLIYEEALESPSAIVPFLPDPVEQEERMDVEAKIIMFVIEHEEVFTFEQASGFAWDLSAALLFSKDRIAWQLIRNEVQATGNMEKLGEAIYIYGYEISQAATSDHEKLLSAGLMGIGITLNSKLVKE